MSLSSQEVMTQIKQNAEEQLEVVCDCLNRCLEETYELEFGDIEESTEETLATEFIQPGICVVLQLGSKAAVVLIPESLPLPSWYQTPDESQNSRLGTLGMEWSMSLLPEEFQGEGFATHAVSNMQAAIERSLPEKSSFVLPVGIKDKEAKILIWGLVTEPALISEPASVEIDEVVEESQSVETSTTTDPVDDAAAEMENELEAKRAELVDRIRRIRRLMRMRIPVSVRLAEKSIQMEQLMNLSPGTLITFNKSCDDLLDLYVNNQFYCRGEAVKIGENFGIKINEVGAEHEEISGILTI